MTVYGPFDKADWKTMSMLRNNIIFMKETSRKKFDTAICKDTSLLKKYIRGDIRKAA